MITMVFRPPFSSGWGPFQNRHQPHLLSLYKRL